MAKIICVDNTISLDTPFVKEFCVTQEVVDQLKTEDDFKDNSFEIGFVQIINKSLREYQSTAKTLSINPVTAGSDIRLRKDGGEAGYFYNGDVYLSGGELKTIYFSDNPTMTFPNPFDFVKHADLTDLKSDLNLRKIDEEFSLFVVAKSAGKHKILRRWTWQVEAYFDSKNGEKETDFLLDTPEQMEQTLAQLFSTPASEFVDPNHRREYLLNGEKLEFS